LLLIYFVIKKTGNYSKKSISDIVKIFVWLFIKSLHWLWFKYKYLNFACSLLWLWLKYLNIKMLHAYIYFIIICCSYRSSLVPLAWNSKAIDW
jgi:hypothetical protein